ncbi:endonuclease domain-containing protein [Corynebacterium sp. 153RC1]|uniref:endonuclease domain-containing protein n=1 Tax=unclassified Corynebacterium TaxID=2624378 RepID=UPI00211B998B|nr:MULTISPECIES: endonuclease domain-containing protein [unclassified Corynebacterium]MCQ9370508.1 endonuclease domain-containing protein [Corynebacterium sp. 35RC1]MCQ9351793.1 endonuclease domain-containing protein [Corynebacterium sp. 209RC1]MCQ9354529.1 endonuclease domain-containing protein [Corynebacterium sp. 1222RC1]MCQ9356075.1 endonuclease domain-containing protein [Corynebacterium sp. 122RC1]MCQ9358707.1 endonuclease domain-containing protein [Corynebacterium sp. 142RC1]
MEIRVYTTWQLRRMGRGKSAVARALRQGKIFRVFRGVYSLTAVTPLVMAHALALHRPGLIFEGTTALQIHRGHSLTFPLRARVASGSVRRTGSFELRRSRLRHHEIVAGLPVVSIADAAQATLRQGEQRDYRLRKFVENAYKGEAGARAVRDDLRRMGCAVKRDLREAMGRDWVLGADSGLERDFIRDLRNVGLDVQPQFRVGSYRWDVGCRKARLVVDVDSALYHLEKDRAFYADRWKTNAALAAGWTALRVTDSCVASHRKEILAFFGALADYRKAHPRKRLNADILPPVWTWHVEILAREGL